MKLLIRLGAILGICGSTLLAPSAANMSALALPQEQVLQKLSPVPVFTITDSQGAPLVASLSKEGEDINASLAGVFINKSDADAFVDRLRTQNPDLASSVKVVPVSLGEVYQMSESIRDNGENLQFTFVPGKQQVESAMTVLEENGKEAEQFNGTPLFLAKGGNEDGYLTIQRGEQQVIPMFFNKEDLQGMLERFNSQQPDIAGSVEIEVVNLEGVIEALRTDDDPFLTKIVLIPPRDSVEFIRQLQEGSGN
jgi:nickel transport protein